MKIKKNKLNYLITLIVPVIITIVFLPVKVSGGFTKSILYGRTTLWDYFSKNSNVCTNCYTYSISWLYLILQFIIVIALTIGILMFLDKRGKRK